MMTRVYQVSGLSVDSEVPLPGLLNVESARGPTDVAIRFGDVPLALDDAALTGPTWAIDGEKFLLRIPGVARFLLLGGRSIVCEPEPHMPRDDVAIFLLGTVLGILLHQRGQVVLHASAVAVNGKAVLFCGKSGAGKSTMAAALGQGGQPCVADDLCRITLRGDGEPIVHSDGRQLKLWAQTIDQLQLAPRSRVRVRRELEKYYVEHGGAVEAPLPIAAVYALREARPPHAAGIQRMSVLDGANAVRRHAYRGVLVERMRQREQYFRVATAVARSGNVYHLTRPLAFAELPQSIANLRRHWSEIRLLQGAT